MSSTQTKQTSTAEAPGLAALLMKPGVAEVLTGALALVALGYRSLSLTPSAIGPVKSMLLELDADRVEALLRPLIESPAGTVGVRDRLEAFAAAEGLPL